MQQLLLFIWYLLFSERSEHPVENEQPYAFNKRQCDRFKFPLRRIQDQSHGLQINVHSLMSSERVNVKSWLASSVLSQYTRRAYPFLGLASPFGGAY